MESIIETLSPDMLFYIALDLDLPDLLNLCESYPKIGNKLCDKPHIWLKLLDRDFKDYRYYKKLLRDKNPKNLYILLRSLTDLKSELDFKFDIYTLYDLESLNIGKKLTKLPSNISVLKNLKFLNVPYNNLKEITFPPFLTKVFANNNKLKTLPDILPSTLEEIYVYSNQLKQLPDNLPDSIKVIHVNKNHLRELPSKLPDSLKFLFGEENLLEKLPNNWPSSLTKLNLSNNQLKEFPKNLPDSLEELFIDNNEIKELLVNSIPISLKFLHIDDNILKNDDIINIRNIRPNLKINYKRL